MQELIIKKSLLYFIPLGIKNQMRVALKVMQRLPLGNHRRFARLGNGVAHFSLLISLTTSAACSMKILSVGLASPLAKLCVS